MLVVHGGGGGLIYIYVYVYVYVYVWFGPGASQGRRELGTLNPEPLQERANSWEPQENIFLNQNLDLALFYASLAPLKPVKAPKKH